jgi:Mrp family chromosome partitioning ATPase
LASTRSTKKNTHHFQHIREGKSFIATNLATSISLTGKKVVVVDLDLHNPAWRNFSELRNIPVWVISWWEELKLKTLFTIFRITITCFISLQEIYNRMRPNCSKNGKVQDLIAQLDADFDMVIY